MYSAMEIGKLVICLCPISLLQYSVRVAEVRLKVAAVLIKHTQAGITQCTYEPMHQYISELKT